MLLNVQWSNNRVAFIVHLLAVSLWVAGVYYISDYNNYDMAIIGKN